MFLCENKTKALLSSSFCHGAPHTAVFDVDVIWGRAHPNTVIYFPAQPSLHFIIATCSPKPGDVLLCCFIIVCLEDVDMNLCEIPVEQLAIVQP